MHRLPLSLHCRPTNAARHLQETRRGQPTLRHTLQRLLRLLAASVRLLAGRPSRQEPVTASAAATRASAGACARAPSSSWRRATPRTTCCPATARAPQGSQARVRLECLECRRPLPTHSSAQQASRRGRGFADPSETPPPQPNTTPHPPARAEARVRRPHAAELAVAPGFAGRDGGRGVGPVWGGGCYACCASEVSCALWRRGGGVRVRRDGCPPL